MVHEISIADWFKIIASCFGMMVSLVTLLWFVIGQKFDTNNAHLKGHVAKELLSEKNIIHEFVEKKSANAIEMIFNLGDKIASLESAHNTEIARLQDRSMETKQKLNEVDNELKQIRETTNAMNVKLDVLIERVKHQ